MAPLKNGVKDEEAAESLLTEMSGSRSSQSDSMDDRPLCHRCVLRDSGKKTPLYQTRGFWLVYANAIFFFTSIFLLVKSHSASSPSAVDPREALKATSAYSPIFDEVDLTPVWDEVDGRLHTSANASVFRGEPSAETDEAWDDLAAEAYEVIMVDADTLEAAGFNSAHYFKAPASWGYGEDKFPVQIDVFHQIHCLNAVRKQSEYSRVFSQIELPEAGCKCHRD